MFVAFEYVRDVGVEFSFGTLVNMYDGLENSFVDMEMLGHG